jgi:hypothetical protein
MLPFCDPYAHHFHVEDAQLAAGCRGAKAQSQEGQEFVGRPCKTILDAVFAVLDDEAVSVPKPWHCGLRPDQHLIGVIVTNTGLSENSLLTKRLQESIEVVLLGLENYVCKAAEREPE